METYSRECMAHTSASSHLKNMRLISSYSCCSSRKTINLAKLRTIKRSSNYYIKGSGSAASRKHRNLLDRPMNCSQLQASLLSQITFSEMHVCRRLHYSKGVHQRLVWHGNSQLEYCAKRTEEDMRLTWTCSCDIKSSSRQVRKSWRRNKFVVAVFAGICYSHML